MQPILEFTLLELLGFSILFVFWALGGVYCCYSIARGEIGTLSVLGWGFLGIAAIAFIGPILFAASKVFGWGY